MNKQDYLIKVKKIINLQIKNYYLPKQRSEEWFNIRKKSIGGSEIATVIDKNPYQTIGKLLYNKLNNIYVNNLLTSWGKLFENVTTSIMKKIIIQGNTLIELSSVPGFMDRQRYSPDGIGIIRTNDGIYKIALFEYKSPSNRFPTMNIPDYYIHQIQAGLSSIKECEIAIFVDCLYKICKINEFDDNNLFNKNMCVKSNMIKYKPIMLGIMYINIDVKKIEEYMKYDDSELLKILNQLVKKNKIIDFGDIKEENLVELIKYIEMKIIDISYEKEIMIINDRIKINDEKVNIQKNINKNNNIQEYGEKLIEKYKEKKNEEKKFVGFLCWKLFNCSILSMDKNEKFAKDAQIYIHKFLEMIDKVYENDIFNRDVYNSLFPTLRNYQY